MKRTILLIAVAFPTISIAENQVCGSITNDLDRLACYDEESGRTPKTVTDKPSGSWVSRTVKSDFEDTTDVFLHVETDEPIQCGAIRGNRPARLFIRCMENTTAVVIQTECHLTSSEYNDYGHVDIRIDDEPAKVVRMDSSTSNNALGLWSGGKSIPFAKTLIGKEQLLARFTPYASSPVTARFDISGLDEAIIPLRESCGW